jgi:hypothetical protein
MIDNPATVARLIAQLHGYLPIPAFSDEGHRPNTSTWRSEGQRRAYPLGEARILRHLWRCRGSGLISI